MTKQFKTHTYKVLKTLQVKSRYTDLQGLQDLVGLNYTLIYA